MTETTTEEIPKAGKEKCLLNECTNTAKYRGLCHRHNRLAGKAIKDGLWTDAKLVERGLRLPKPAHGSNDSFEWHGGRARIQDQQTRRSVVADAPDQAHRDAQLVRRGVGPGSVADQKHAGP